MATTPEMPVIEARALEKRYGNLVAVAGIDFSVRPKECFGFLGPNGAGKSSTIKMIHCFSPLSGGSLQVLGLDVVKRARDIKRRMGVVPQEDTLDPDLTVRENLLVYASYFSIPAPLAVERADELLGFMALGEKAAVKVPELSGGMRRRLVIARALINAPELLILDEPTTGLDPQARHLIWQRLRGLRARGVTMVLTTHYMEEAERLCDRLVIMDSGKILDQGTPRELIERHARREIVEVRATGFVPQGEGEGDGQGEDRLQALMKACARLAPEHVGDTIYFQADDGRRLQDEIAAITGSDGLLILHRPANLEDVFLRLTGRELRE